MSDAWGGSWGTAWGISWSAGAPTPEPDVILLGGKAYSAYPDRKRRDIAKEILEDREQIAQKERDETDLKRALEVEGLKSRQVKKLEKELKLIQAETLRLQQHIQNLVAIKERMELENEETLFILSMSLPFTKLKI